MTFVYGLPIQSDYRYNSIYIMEIKIRLFSMVWYMRCLMGAVKFVFFLCPYYFHLYLLIYLLNCLKRKDKKVFTWLRVNPAMVRRGQNNLHITENRISSPPPNISKVCAYMKNTILELNENVDFETPFSPVFASSICLEFGIRSDSNKSIGISNGWSNIKSYNVVIWLR